MAEVGVRLMAVRSSSAITAVILPTVLTRADMAKRFTASGAVGFEVAGRAATNVPMNESAKTLMTD